MARRPWSRKYLSDTNEEIVEYKENEEERAEKIKKEDIEGKRKRDQRAESEVPGSNAIHRIFNNFPSDEEIRNLWPEIIKSEWMENTPGLHELRRVMGVIPSEEYQEEMRERKRKALERCIEKFDEEKKGTRKGTKRKSRYMEWG